uniref:V-set immunoregulatory receptor n=1 Tax=Labrus bergylta TaxID=56723 RepID=A0A3Q3FB67_9LABR
MLCVLVCMKSHPSSTLSVSAPHLFYTCPEGATAKLVCGQSGAALHQTDVLKRSWLFTPHADQHCSGKEGPRHTNVGGHSHGNHSLTPGLHFGSSEQNFWMVLQNVTLADQGRYCCLLLDFQVEHKHGVIVQKPHSHMILQVSPRKFSGVLISRCCHVQVLSCPDVVMSRCLAPVVVAASACIIALFALPLILLLVYKQRQTHKSRRMYDAHAQGHENPVFFGESPQARTRTVSQIMTRQSSETGRHLLSEPGTPLSPPAHGDVFFPIEDTIPESPDLLQV